MPGVTTGTVTDHNCRSQPAPSIEAASYNSLHDIAGVVFFHRGVGAIDINRENLGDLSQRVGIPFVFGPFPIDAGLAVGARRIRDAGFVKEFDVIHHKGREDREGDAQLTLPHIPRL